VLIPAPRSLGVVQPLPGIGDMIWHLPHIRALSRHVGHPVTLIAKPRSTADQIFKAERTVRDVLWVDRNPEGRRGRHDGPFGMARLIADLRARRFDAIVLLHHSRSLAFFALCASIPARYGYGFHLQRPFLNRPPYLPASVLRMHPFEQASAWLAAADIPLGEPEPRLPVSPDSEATVLRRLGVGAVRPVAIGIGSSEPYKQWGVDRFADLATNLLNAGWSRLVLIGGNAEAALADDIRSRISAGADQLLPAIGWELSELAALLNVSAFYVGNDTGVMNMAAAVGIRSYGLFGGTPPFYHSSNIVPILPPDGVPDKVSGMARITVQAVLAALAAERDCAVAHSPSSRDT
jgi:heptosyltransferase-2